MKPLLQRGRHALFSLIGLMPACASLAAGQANDFPTVSRVEYVVECMREAPVQSREYLYKCACVVDAIAQRMSYDEFVQESTVTNAITIGGERGEVARGMRGGRKVVRHFHEVENEARKACFMKPRG